MQTLRWFSSTALLVLAGLIAPGTAQAAQSYDNCTGFIDSVPATITTQGTWCLRKDLATAITSGNAITINTNNVTIDCNHFKLGGLQAGDSSTAFGIRTDNRVNASVRHCNVRGFYFGIFLHGGGHLIEDNRLDQNLYVGIYVIGDNNMVRRNAVYDTGGFTGFASSFGINGQADVIDNTVSGVFATAVDTYPTGIFIFGDNSELRGNRVRGLVVAGGGHAFGIRASSGAGIRIDGNHVSAGTLTNGSGIYGSGSTDTFCRDNTASRFTTGIFNCRASEGNDSF